MSTARIVGAAGLETLIRGRSAAWLLEQLRGAPPPNHPDVVEDVQNLTLIARWWTTRTTSGISGRNVAGTAEVAPPSVYVTSSQAHRLTGLTDRAVRLACAQGRLPAERDAAGHWRIRRTDLDRWRRDAA